MNDHILNNLNFSHFKFFNEPKFCERGYYDSAIDSYVSIVQGEDNLRAIYQIGNIGSFGISDIDLAVIVDNSDKKTDYSRYSISNLSVKERYVFTHEPILLPLDVVEFIDLLCPVYKINKIYGEDVYFNKSFDPLQLKLINLINAITLFYPRELLWPIFKRQIDVRSMLCRLNLLCYLFKDIEQISGINLNEFEVFTNSIKELRNRWFELDRSKYRVLIEILIDSLRLVLRMIDMLLNYVLSNKIIESLSEYKDNYFITSSQTLFFSKAWSQKASLSNSIELFKHSGMVASFLPVELMVLLAEFSSISSIKKMINRSMKHSDIRFKCVYDQVLAQRKIIINKQVCSYEQNGKLFMNLGIMYLAGLDSAGMIDKLKMLIKRYKADRFNFSLQK
jgi:hypothetical protein